MPFFSQVTSLHCAMRHRPYNSFCVALSIRHFIHTRSSWCNERLLEEMVMNMNNILLSLWGTWDLSYMSHVRIYVEMLFVLKVDAAIRGGKETSSVVVWSVESHVCVCVCVILCQTKGFLLFC